jgi:chromosome segregation ATPase
MAYTGQSGIPPITPDRQRTAADDAQAEYAKTIDNVRMTLENLAHVRNRLEEQIRDLKEQLALVDGCCKNLDQMLSTPANATAPIVGRDLPDLERAKQVRY